MWSFASYFFSFLWILFCKMLRTCGGKDRIQKWDWMVWRMTWSNASYFPFHSYSTLPLHDSCGIHVNWCKLAKTRSWWSVISYSIHNFFVYAWICCVMWVIYWFTQNQQKRMHRKCCESLSFYFVSLKILDFDFSHYILNQWELQECICWILMPS